MGCGGSKVDTSSSSSSTNGLGRPPHAQGMNLADLAHLAILDKRFCAVLLSGDLKLLDADFLREVGEKGLERMLKRQDLEDYERRTGIRVFVPPAEAVAIMRGGGRRIASLSYGWCSAGSPDPTNVYLKHVRRFLRDPLGAHIKAVFWDYGSLCTRPGPSPFSALLLFVGRCVSHTHFALACRLLLLPHMLLLGGARTRSPKPEIGCPRSKLQRGVVGDGGRVRERPRRDRHPAQAHPAAAGEL